MTHDESFTDVFDAAPVSLNKRSGRGGGKKRVNTSFLDEDVSVVKLSKVAGSSLPEKTPICNSKENVPPPVNCAQLYMNKSLYTQELSQSAGYLPTEIHQASFHSDGGEEYNMNSSLTRGMDKAMQLVDSLTPIKQNKLPVPRTPQDRAVLTPSNKQSLLPPPSPAVSRLQPSTPCSKGSFQTSTPVRKPLLPSPTTKPILSPVGIVFLQASSHPLPSVQMAPSWRYIRKEE